MTAMKSLSVCHETLTSEVQVFYVFMSVLTSSVNILTISARQTKTDTCAISVEPNETAHNEPSH